MSFWGVVHLLTYPLFPWTVWCYIKELDRRGDLTPENYKIIIFTLIAVTIFFTGVQIDAWEKSGIVFNLLCYPVLRIGLLVERTLKGMKITQALNQPPPTPEPQPEPVVQFPPPDDVTHYLTNELINIASIKGVIIPFAIQEILRSTIAELYRDNLHNVLRGEAQYTVVQAIKEKKTTHEEVLQLFENRIVWILSYYVEALPKVGTDSLFLVPVSTAIDTRQVTIDMQMKIREEIGFGLFQSLYKQVNANQWAVTRSKLSEKEIAAPQTKRIYPNTFPGTEEELVQGYWASTPFRQLFTREISYPLKADTRLQHQFMLVPSGRGKTQCIQAQIAHDLDAVLAGEASIMIIDSQGLDRRDPEKPTLIENMINLRLFAKGKPLENKLTYVKPDEDLALNIFDAGQDDPKLTPDERRVRLVAIREIVAFSLGGATELQFQMLRWCTRLALLHDKPNIHTLRSILTTKEKDFPRVFGAVLNDTRTTQATRNYFASLFDPIRNPSRMALATRIDNFIEDDVFLAMLEKPTNDIKLIDQIEAGNVIVVNADKGVLGDYGTEAFGRFFMAQLLMASRQRKTKKPVYVYMDECQDFVSNDENIAKMLIQVRKWDIGFIFATQNLININSSKVKENLRDVAIYIDTSKGKPDLTFNMHLRTKEEPIEVKVRLKTMEDMDRMTPEEFAEVHRPKVPPLKQRVAQAPTPPTSDDVPAKDDDVL